MLAAFVECIVFFSVLFEVFLVSFLLFVVVVVVFQGSPIYP
jgi:hypothetical protein